MSAEPLDSGLGGEVAPTIYGSTEARIFTPPLRELTDETSYGFAVIEFARDFLLQPLDPWEEFAVIHAGELLEDGTPRFHRVMILVARQNGKTFLLVVLALFWMFVEQVSMVLGMSTKIDYAYESWNKAVETAQGLPWLAQDIQMVKQAMAQQELKLHKSAGGSRYKIAAATSKGGRSLTAAKVIVDELREHKDYSAYSAVVPTTGAVVGSQVFFISNMGGEDSVVLNDLQDEGLADIENGTHVDSTMCLLEWSAPPNSDPEDPYALAKANPNLGYRKNLKILVGAARAAKRAGGEALVTFRTEEMCIRVRALNPAINLEQWKELAEPDATMSSLRDRLACCLDVSLDRRHASLLVAAVRPDGKVQIEVAHEWRGDTCTRDVRAELRGWIDRLKPKTLGWFPEGPAAALAADLRTRGYGWPPPGVKLEEIRADKAAACMMLVDLVDQGDLVHADQKTLNRQVEYTEKKYVGDRFEFTRRGMSPCDGTYALAGSVYLARTMAPSKGKQKLLLPRG